MLRYFIEQAPDRFYSAAELNAAKARARRLSNSVNGVYLIAEKYNSDPFVGDYERVGSIVFYDGRQDACEGCFATVSA